MQKKVMIVVVLLLVLVVSSCAYEDKRLEEDIVPKEKPKCAETGISHFTYDGGENTRFGEKVDYLCAREGFVSCIAQANPTGNSVCTGNEAFALVNATVAHFTRTSDLRSAENVWGAGPASFGYAQALDTYFGALTGTNERLKYTQKVIDSYTPNKDGLLKVSDFSIIQGQSGLLLTACTAQTQGYYLSWQPNEQLAESKDGKPAETRKLFYCAFDGKSYKWIDKATLVAQDPDQDGVPLGFDCDNTDPSKHGDFSLYNKDKAALPICGDKKANTCGVIPEAQELAEDDCDLPTNQAICEQRCLTADGQCDWVTSTQGDFCCGDDGLADVGKTTQAADGVYVCMNKNAALAQQTDKKVPPGWADRCLADGKPKEWCWVSATGSADFNVFTQQDAQTSVYHDIVSNGNQFFKCDATTQGPLADPTAFSSGSNADYQKFLALKSRFYCYQEGNRWSWAECVPGQAGKEKKEIQNKYKARFAGEGLYTLPLFDAKKERVHNLTGSPLIISAKDMQEVYGEGVGFDFTGYDYLNVLVRFSNAKGEALPIKDIKLPADIELSLSDKEQELFFERVLGYVINTPFSQDGWMHLQIPLPTGLKDVQIVEFTSISVDAITIKQVYLSKKDPAKNPICSGIESTQQGATSWLESADTGDNRNKIRGEELCKARYGEHAWLGDNQEVTSVKDSCCGNQKNEYYAGPSRDGYACWNSLALGTGETATNIEYSITYKPSKYESLVLDDKGYALRVDVEAGSYKKTPWFSSLVDDVLQGGKKAQTIAYLSELRKEANTVYVYCEKTSTTTDRTCFGYEWNPEKSIAYVAKENSHPTINPAILSSFLVNKKDYTQEDGMPYAKFTLTVQGIDQVNYYFYDPLAPQGKRNLGKSFLISDLELPLTRIQIRADISLNAGIFSAASSSQTTPFSYPCNQKECVLPLPFSTDDTYTITPSTNKAYELYLVTVTGEELITSSKQFTGEGVLVAKRVAQQVIYDKVKEQFFGCGYSSTHAQSIASCSVYGGSFCSPGSLGTVASWSKEPITRVGYEDVKAPQGAADDFYKNLPLTLKKLEKPITAEQRNHTASVIPGRNFLPNAIFQLNQEGVLSSWELLENNVLVRQQRATIDTKQQSVALKAGQKLRSNWIAIPQNKELLFNFTGSADFNVVTLSPNGKESVLRGARPLKLATADATHVRVIFTPSQQGGTISQAILQVFDEVAAQYSDYKPQEELNRQGVACCPNNYCWNGYSCVEPMGKSSFLAETTAKTYRCVAGEWQDLPVQWDWQRERWGFCERKEQCFVTPASQNAKIEYTAADFYQGKFPVCINDGEYIFDNLCDQGNWTSRTGALATKLLEVASSDEFALYCGDINGTLPETKTYENLIYGQATAKVEKSGLLGKQEQQQKVCFQAVATSEEGQRLVPHQDNTCINNVCVLEYKKSGEFKVALATSLNKPVTDGASFLLTLGIAQGQQTTACTKGNQNEVECQLPTSIPGSLWHMQDINSVVYSKDNSFTLQKSFSQKMVDWLKNLFGLSSKLEANKAFLDTERLQFVYVLNKDGKKARAVLEETKDTTKIIAEYEGFSFPICSYVEQRELPADVAVGPLQQAAGAARFVCNATKTGERLEVLGGKKFWPELTSQLRIK